MMYEVEHKKALAILGRPLYLPGYVPRGFKLNDDGTCQAIGPEGFMANYDAPKKTADLLAVVEGIIKNGPRPTPTWPPTQTPVPTITLTPAPRVYPGGLVVPPGTPGTPRTVGTVIVGKPVGPGTPTATPGGPLALTPTPTPRP